MLEGVLELLDHFARRTGMHVQPVEVATVQSYLDGLRAGCSIAGLAASREVYERAARSRGWKSRATGIVWHMQAKKLDDAAVIQELIAVEAEAFRLAAGSDPSEPGQRVK
jgi:hypothetical protein